MSLTECLGKDKMMTEWEWIAKIGKLELQKIGKSRMPSEEDLPWPNVELTQQWWQNHKQEFQNGTRCLCGPPMSIGSLTHVLRNGFQRQRIVLVLELFVH